MAEEKKFNIQESGVICAEKDGLKITFPSDTKCVEQVNVLPFFIVEKESGECDLIELADGNRLYGVLLNCEKIALPTKLTEDNKYLLAYWKKMRRTLACGV